MDYELSREFRRYAEIQKARESANSKVPTEILQAITAVKSAIDGINILNKYAEDIKDTQKRGELIRIIGQLSLDLGNAQIQLSQQLLINNEMAQKIEHLEKEIENLKNPSEKLIVKDGLYYKDENDGPYCTGCYDTKKLIVRLKKLTGPFTAMGTYQCPSCNTPY